VSEWVTQTHTHSAGRKTHKQAACNAARRIDLLSSGGGGGSGDDGRAPLFFAGGDFIV